MLAALPCSAQSLRVDYQALLTYTHSDNINLSETAPDSDAVLMPELRFDATKSGSRVQLEARGTLKYLMYRDDTYDDDLAGQFIGQSKWVLLPERINFVVEDYLDRQTVDVRGGFTPTNQEQVNVFLAGPTFLARFSETMRGQVDLRYINTYAEENKRFNGDRYSVAGRLFRELNALEWLSFNAEATEASFDLADASADYRRYDAYIGYWRKLREVELNAAVGYSRLQLIGGEHLSSPLARASVDWNPSPRSTLTAKLDYSFGDAASNLITQGDIPEVPIDIDTGNNNVAAGPDAFRQRRFDLGYRFEGERLSFEVRPFYQRIDYLESGLPDVESRGLYAGLGYQLRPLLTLSVSGARQSRELFDGSQRDDDAFVRVELVKQFTRHWSGSIGAQRTERDSNVAGQSYEENTAMLSVTYRR